MAQCDTVKTQGVSGNTKTNTRSRSYCFTWNNYTEEDKNKMLSYLGTMTQYIVGYEVGEKGTPHLQGYFYNKNPLYFNKIKQDWPKCHWEQAKGKTEDNYNYCSKSGNFDTNIIKEKNEPIKIIENLYDWQKEIEKKIKEEPDDRTINWIVDYKGNSGKTAFCKYLVTKYKAIYVTGKANDIKHLIADSKIKPKIVLFDYCRSMEDYISYQAIEEIKNGIFFSGKYESKMCIMNSPHVVVFSNCDPQKNKLSLDRWNIVYLGSVEPDDSASDLAVDSLSLDGKGRGGYPLPPPGDL